MKVVTNTNGKEIQGVSRNTETLRLAITPTEAKEFFNWLFFFLAFFPDVDDLVQHGQVDPFCLGGTDREESEETT